MIAMNQDFRSTHQKLISWKKRKLGLANKHAVAAIQILQDPLLVVGRNFLKRYPGVNT